MYIFASRLNIKNLHKFFLHCYANIGCCQGSENWIDIDEIVRILLIFRELEEIEGISSGKTEVIT